MMKVSVLYVGSSLLSPLRQAEREINRRYHLGLTVAAHNGGAPLNETQWRRVKGDLDQADLVFILHVTDAENAARIAAALDQDGARPRAVIAINCLPDLMRRTRMGSLSWNSASKSESPAGKTNSFQNLVHKLGSWIADYVKERGKAGPARQTGQYMKFIERLPVILRLVPRAGKLGDIRNYLYLFCYFLQPTPKNIEAMLLFAIKHYVPGYAKRFKVSPPESMPAVGIYHPDAPSLFGSLESYRRWYGRSKRRDLGQNAIGLLLMRPHIVSGARHHYDGLIRAIESEGLAVVPIISTFMDNREACREFLIDKGDGKPVVGQIVSLTGFSFVGGPAMNDHEAAMSFLRELNVPFRSVVSLDIQTVESWEQSQIGLNPVQTVMQVAIPEIDGATEPFIYGGLTSKGEAPEPLEDRCRRIARRLKRWSRLQALPRAEARLALLVFCFPPNKGNLGTAADLDVFPSLLGILKRLQAEGYACQVPADAEALRRMLLEGNSDLYGATANVAYRMSANEYRRLCPYVKDIETDWGPAPGRINALGHDLLILGTELGNIFIGVQPTFGYEGDPLRMMMAHSGAPHHGFMALYTYLEKVFRADAVVHVGTHGALEFMPGKQVGLSGRCWPDRLIGELPHVYIYSVNNPSEGSIAKRRSYAELISYLTPPIENAGLYRELASLKELLMAYRQATTEAEREQLFSAIGPLAQRLNLHSS